MADTSGTHAVPETSKWGLDPTFWSYMKLANMEILSLPEHEEHLGCFLLGNRVVSKIHILGDVVSVHERERNIQFSVDDGSAVLLCVLWKNRDGADWEETASGIRLGQVVRVMGKISVFREERQVSVVSWSHVTDVHAMCVHWLSVIKLHRDIYDQPASYPSAQATVPAAVQKTSFTGEMSKGFAGVLEKFFKDDNDGKGASVGTIQGIPHLHCEALKVLRYTEPLTAEQTSFLQRLYISSLRQLVSKGVLFQSDINTEVYRVISIEEHIVPAVRAVVRNQCCHGYEGVSVKQVTVGLRGQQMWTHVTDEQIREALRLCVLSSHMYEVDPGQYRPV